MKKEYLIIITASIVIALICDWAIDSYHKVISVEKIRLIDQTGMVRAELAVSSEGNPGLTFWDKEGMPTVYLYQADSSSSFTLYDSKRRTRAELGLSPNENPQLLFWDKEEKLGLSLGLTDNDRNLCLYDENTLRAAISLDLEEDCPILVLCDRGGQYRTSLFYNPKEGPHMALHNQYGQLIWSARKDLGDF